MKTEELENYVPKGDLEGFPKEIISRMLECQVEQGNKRDVTVFERNVYSSVDQGGFDWDKTIEKGIFWSEVISANNLKLFFKKYPEKQEYQELKNNKNMQENNKKEEDSQEFKVGDKVIDIITGQKGKILKVCTDDDVAYPIYVNLNEKESYKLDGKYYEDDKHPRLFHYRDDYDYSIINFNNLPKRQEPKRWRGKLGDVYYTLGCLNGSIIVSLTTELNKYLDNQRYLVGNYFQSEDEAQEIANKLQDCFKQLIQN